MFRTVSSRNCEGGCGSVITCWVRAALRVNRMADFVSDDGADGAIIGRRRGLRIKERWLKDGSREVERILERKIDGVHRLRRHGPFLAIDREAETRDILVVLKQTAAPDVS